MIEKEQVLFVKTSTHFLLCILEMILAAVSFFFGANVYLSCIKIFAGVFGSASTLREQFDAEKAALQQSIHKNSALITEKEQLVQNLRSEVGIKLTTAHTFIQMSRELK